MRIGNFEVGSGHPVFIVAEGGSNHGTSFEMAIALTDAAAEMGASAMKWQLWISADEVYDRAQFPNEWEAFNTWRLPIDWLPHLRDRAHERGMAFGLSSFGFASLDEADKVVDFHKVASIESGWNSFVQAVRAKSKPWMMSLGMTDRIRIDLGEGAPILLGCTVSYPCNPGDVHLRAMPFWAKSFGLSDHTKEVPIAAVAAVAMGACVIEKHIRRNAPMFQNRANIPPDWNHSVDTHAFRQMVNAIRETEFVLGSSEMRIRDSELPYTKYLRGPQGLRGA